MGKPFVATLAVLALLAAAALWLLRRGDGASRPEVAARGQTDPITAPPRARRLPMERARAQGLAVPECRPVDGGGFTCGACREDADCPPSSACAIDWESGRTECLASECSADSECPNEMVCRADGEVRGDEPLRRCVPRGARAEGASCEPGHASDTAVSCGKDLICVQGGCAPSCAPADPDEPDACPGGVPCVKTPDGWGCIPSCQHRACGGGKQCLYLSVESPIALCTYATGDNCLYPGRCGPDQECLVETNPRAERTTFECVPSCTPGAVGRSCPMGTVCIASGARGQCRRACAPGEGGACRSDERCTRAVGTETWFCTTL
jgi:hypothetical protein